MGAAINIIYISERARLAFDAGRRPEGLATRESDRYQRVQIRIKGWMYTSYEIAGVGLTCRPRFLKT